MGTTGMEEFCLTTSTVTPRLRTTSQVSGEAFRRFDGLVEGQIHEFDAAAQIFGDLSENPGIEALVGRDEGHLKFVLREHLFSPCVLPRSPAPGCEG